MTYKRYKVNVITTFTNLILALRQLVAISLTRNCCGWGTKSASESAKTHWVWLGRV